MVRGLGEFLRNSHVAVEVDLLKEPKPVRLLVDYQNFKFQCTKLLSTHMTGNDPIPKTEVHYHRLVKMLRVLRAHKIELEFIRHSRMTDRSTHLWNRTWRERNKKNLDDSHRALEDVLSAAHHAIREMMPAAGEVVADAVSARNPMWTCPGNADQFCAAMMYQRNVNPEGHQGVNEIGRVWGILSSRWDVVGHPGAALVSIAEGFDLTESLLDVVKDEGKNAADLKELIVEKFTSAAVAEKLYVTEEELVELFMLAGTQETNAYIRSGPTVANIRASAMCLNQRRIANIGGNIGAIEIDREGCRRVRFNRSDGTRERNMRYNFDHRELTPSMLEYVEYLRGAMELANTPIGQHMEWKEFMYVAASKGERIMTNSSGDLHNGELWFYPLLLCSERKGGAQFFDYVGDYLALHGHLYRPVHQRLIALGVLGTQHHHSEYIMRLDQYSARDSRWFFGTANAKDRLAVFDRLPDLVPLVEEYVRTHRMARDVAANVAAKNVLNTVASPTDSGKSAVLVFYDFVCASFAALRLQPRPLMNIGGRHKPFEPPTLLDMKVIFLTLILSIGASEAPLFSDRPDDPLVEARCDLCTGKLKGAAQAVERFKSRARSLGWSSPEHRLRAAHQSNLILVIWDHFQMIRRSLALPTIPSLMSHHFFHGTIYKCVAVCAGNFGQTSLDNDLTIDPFAEAWSQANKSLAFRMASGKDPSGINDVVIPAALGGA